MTDTWKTDEIISSGISAGPYRFLATGEDPVIALLKEAKVRAVKRRGGVMLIHGLGSQVGATVLIGPDYPDYEFWAKVADAQGAWAQ
jgi:hypothetical protein